MTLSDDLNSLIFLDNLITGDVTLDSGETHVDGFNPLGDVTPDVNGNYIFLYNFLATANELSAFNGYDPTTIDGDPVSLEFDAFQQLTTLQKQSFSYIFEGGNDAIFSNFYSDVVTNLTFQSASSADIAHINIGQVVLQSGAAGYTKEIYNPDDQTPEPLPGGQNFDANYGSRAQGDIWLNTNYVSGWESIELGKAGFFTILHEIGHSLGLKHPENDELNSTQFTIMATTAAEETELLPYNLQLYDIAAIQEIFGTRNYDTRNLGTVYNIQNAFTTDENGAFIYTIWDGGGIDTIFAYELADNIGFSESVKIDLRQGEFSSIGTDGTPDLLDLGINNGFKFNVNGDGSFDPSGITKEINNVAIAFHTVIENAAGTSSDDVLIGNAWNNILRGHEGDDHIYGDGVVYDGNEGFTEIDEDDLNDPNRDKPESDDDTLFGGDGNDFLYGGAGDDVLDGGEGQDYIDGGTGHDIVDLSASAEGVTANIGTPLETRFSNTPQFDPNGDTVLNVEEVVGSDFDDVFYVAQGQNISIDGGDGSDQLRLFLGAERTSVVGNELQSIWEIDMGNADATGGFDRLTTHDLSFSSSIEFSNIEHLTTVNSNDTFVRMNAPSGMTLEADIHAEGTLFGYFPTGSFQYADYSDVAGGMTFDLQTIQVGQSGTEGMGSASFTSGGAEAPVDTLINTFGIFGTNSGDRYNLSTNGGRLSAQIYSGTGDDDVYGAPAANYFYSGGNDVLSHSSFSFPTAGVTASKIWMKPGVASGDVSVEIFDKEEVGNTLQGTKIFTYKLKVTVAGLGEIEVGTYRGEADDENSPIEAVSMPYFEIHSPDGWKIDLRTDANDFVAEEISIDARPGSAGDDIITADDDGDILEGYGGNDTLIGGAGNDEISGGFDDDILRGGGGDDFLAGGSGNDILNGGEGYDVLAGGGGDDVITGEEDLIVASEGHDQIYGTSNILSFQLLDSAEGLEISQSSGNTVIYLDNGASSIAFNDGAVSTLQFGSGFTITLDEVLLAQGEEILNGSASDEALLGDSANSFIFGGAGNDDISGGGGNDALDGGDGVDQIHGGTGSDDIVGGLGDDLLWGGNGADVLDGGADHDTIYGDQGNDTIFGGGGNDVLDGGDGTDDIYGGSGDDILRGGAGDDKGSLHGGDDNDTLTGGSGDDDLHGDAGDDTYLFDFGSAGTEDSGRDVISDSSGNDVIQLTTASTLDELSFYQNGDDLVIRSSVDGQTDDDTLTVSNFYADPEQVVEVLRFSTYEQDYDYDLVSLGNGLAAQDDSYDVNGDVELSGNLFIDNGNGVDFDPQKGVITIANAGIITSDQGGLVTLSENGDFTYLNAAGFDGTDSFTYTITDSDGDTDTATVDITVYPAGNDAPVAVDDIFFIPEDQMVVGNVLDDNGGGADFDPNGDTLTVEDGYLFTNFEFIVEMNPDGSFVFEGGYGGPQTAEYTIHDGNGGSDTGNLIFVFTQGPFVTQPTAVDDAFTVDVGGSIYANVLDDNGSGADFDPDGDELSVVPVTYLETENGGEVFLYDFGGFGYTAAEGFNGLDSFDYYLSDGTGGIDVGTVTIQVGEVNNEPVANDDSFEAIEGHVLTGNVLDDNGGGADFDPDGDTLSVEAEVITTVAGGSVVMNADGSFQYAPAAGYTGTDSFEYTLLDGAGGQSVGTVSLGVVADSPSTITGTDGNDQLLGTIDDDVISGLTGNDTILGGGGDDQLSGGTGDDVYVFGAGDGNDLIIEESGIDTLQISGNLVLDDLVFTQIGNDLQIDIASGVTISGQFSGDPALVVEFISFEDGTVVELPNPFMQTNQPPIAVGETYFGDEDVMIIGNVLTNDSDPDGDTITAEAASFTTSRGGTVELLANGDFTYTPAANYFGADSFEYTILDGKGGSDTAQANFNISPVNDAPDAVDDAFSVAEDGVLNGNVLYNDSDADFFDFVSAVAETITTAQGVSVTISSNGSFSYTPPAGFSGVDSFEYTAEDGQGGFDTATVTIDVIASNSDPVAGADAFAVNEDTVLDGNVLGNDSDIDGDILSVVAGTITTAQGVTFEINTDGSFSYTPPANFNGADSFEYTVSDGQGGFDTATVTIDVQAVNDDPQAGADAFAVNEDTVLDGNVLGNDGDIDGDILSVVAGTITTAQGVSFEINADGSFSYTPPANFNGADSFEYTVSDGQGGFDTASVSIDVQAVNDAPEAGDDNFDVAEDGVLQANVLGNDSDPENDALSVVPQSITTSTGATVELLADGNFTYTPAADTNGPDSFEYTITDGENTDTATVNINVLSANDMPDAVDDAFTVDEDNTLDGNVLGNDGDIDGDILSVVAGTITTAQGVSFDIAADGSFSYTPPANFNGADSFEYTVSDGQGGFDMATVSIDVQAVNDDPQAGDDSFAVNEDTVLDGNVLGNDTDIDGDALSVVAGTIITAQGVSFEINADGSFSYTPPANFNGADSFEYTVSDGNGGFDTASVSIDVQAVNDAPEAGDDSFAVAEDGVLQANVLGNDSDIDGDVLSVVAGTITTAQGVSFEINADGSFSYTPPANFNGADSFEYTVSDGNGGFDTASVSIDVQAVNDAPVANDDSFAGIEGQLIAGNVLADNGSGVDFDTDGDALSVEAAVLTTAAGGSVTLNADGSFEYVPAVGFNGADSFDYTLLDGAGGQGIATVSLNVSADNTNDDIVGTEGRDRLNGTNEDDVIQGLGGNDLLRGKGGDDEIFGDDGKDILLGGKGDDLLDGGAGRDRLYGHKGDDELLGQEGDDKLYGNRGDDILNGGAGDDKIWGGHGNDILVGGESNENVIIIDKDFSGDNITFPTLMETVNIHDLSPPGDPALGIISGDLSVNYETEATVTFLETGAGYRNTLGFYNIDEDGYMFNTEIPFDNVHDFDSGSEATITLPGAPDIDFGLFIISNGYSVNCGYKGIDFDDGNLNFFFGYGTDGQRTANINDDASDITLVFTDDSGDTILNGDLYHTTERGGDTNLNADGQIHTISGFVEGEGTDTLRVGFEDLYGTGDADYNDVVLDITIMPQITGVSEAIDGNDILRGGGGDDILIGGAGNDILYGGSGADIFRFDDISAVDEVRDFSMSEGDVLDLVSILEDTDVSETQDAIDEFVRLTDNGDGTYTLAVDESGGGDNYQDVAVISNADAQALVSAQELIDAGSLMV